MPVPYFRRQLELPRDRRELSEVLGRAVNELGMRVPARWAHETLGIPMASEGEKTLEGGSWNAENASGGSESSDRWRVHDTLGGEASSVLS